MAVDRRYSSPPQGCELDGAINRRSLAIVNRLAFLRLLLCLVRENPSETLVQSPNQRHAELRFLIGSHMAKKGGKFKNYLGRVTSFS